MVLLDPAPKTRSFRIKLSGINPHMCAQAISLYFVIIFFSSFHFMTMEPSPPRSSAI